MEPEIVMQEDNVITQHAIAFPLDDKNELLFSPSNETTFLSILAFQSLCYILTINLLIRIAIVRQLVPFISTLGENIPFTIITF